MHPFDPKQRPLRASLRAIRLVATDVDGTLTTAGVLTTEVVALITELTTAGIEVVPVSGRAAGEVLGLVRYLPGVRRGIAENGQVGVEPDRPLTWLVEPGARDRIERDARRIAATLGEPLELAPDAFCRVGDVAFERAGRDDATIAGLANAAATSGLHVVWSSVHIHFSSVAPDKGAALVRLLDVDGMPREAVLTMGDAPNDAGLFVRGRFGVSIGTADVRAHAEHIAARPDYVCATREGAAFTEVARALLAVRRT